MTNIVQRQRAKLMRLLERKSPASYDGRKDKLLLSTAIGSESKERHTEMMFAIQLNSAENSLTSHPCSLLPSQSGTTCWEA